MTKPVWDVEMRNTYGNGSGGAQVYAVEARSIAPEPQVVEGVTLDNRWKRLRFAEKPVGGVPNHVYPKEAALHGFVAYDTALAMAAWLRAGERFGQVETRIVAVWFKWEWSAEEVGVGPVQSSREPQEFQPRETP